MANHCFNRETGKCEKLTKLLIPKAKPKEKPKERAPMVIDSGKEGGVLLDESSIPWEEIFQQKGKEEPPKPKKRVGADGCQWDLSRSSRKNFHKKKNFHDCSERCDPRKIDPRTNENYKCCLSKLDENGQKVERTDMYCGWKKSWKLGKMFRQAVNSDQCRCKGGEKETHCYVEETGGCEPKGKKLQSLSGMALNSLGESIYTVISPVLRSSFGMGNFLVKSFLNVEPEKITNLLQWLLANWVLENDDPRLSCEGFHSEGTIRYWKSKPHYGHCYFNVSSVLKDEEGEVTGVFTMPLYTYDDKVHHKHFTIHVEVKAGKLRCLERLTIKKMRCYGPLLTRGGRCEVEIAPHEECPLQLTDLEVLVYCQGHCDAGSFATAALDRPDDPIEGDDAYIEDENEENGWTDSIKDWWSGNDVRERKLLGCGHDESKGKCVRIVLDRGVTKYCFEAKVAHGSSPAGAHLGCWPRRSIKTDYDCGWKGAAHRWAYSKLGGRETEVVDKRVLLYRKANVKLNNLRVRTRIFLHYTRNIDTVVDEDKGDPNREGGAYKVMKNAFSWLSLKKWKHTFQKAVGTYKTPIERVAQYKINVQEVTNAEGGVTGYKLITCNAPTWSEATGEYTGPPLAKCYRMRLANTQFIPKQNDWIQLIEEETPDTTTWGFDWANRIKKMTGYENHNFVLGLIQNVARMILSNGGFHLKVTDPNGLGPKKYCEDKWKDDKGTDLEARKARSAGIKCDSNVDPSDKVIPAAYEFVFVELPPVWSRTLRRNEQVVAIRGGYNMQYCHMTEPRGKKQQQKLLCDLDVPLDSTTGRPVPEKLSEYAKFKLIHDEKYERPAKMVLEFWRDITDYDPKCKDADGNVIKCPEQEPAEPVDEDDEPSSTLSVKLINMGMLKESKGKLGACRLKERNQKLVCDSRVDIHESNEYLHWLELEGNFATLIPDPIWDHLIVLTLVCVGTWSSLFSGGARMIWSMMWSGQTTIVPVMLTEATIASLVGFGIQMVANEHWYLDGRMIRYMFKRKMESICHMIFLAVEDKADFEFPRFDLR
jgi:hypothetical protein